MEINLQAEKAETSSLTFKDVLFKYVRFLPLFVISLALALLVAYIYLRYTTSIYQSTGALIVKEDNSSGSGIGGGGNDRFQQMFVMDNSINIKNEIEIIKSRPLLKRVVEGLDLNLSYYVIGKIKESNIYTTCPFKVEIFEIADSSNKFSLSINIENNNSFRLGNNETIYSFGQKFENDYGVFRLLYNPIASLSKEYRVEWAIVRRLLCPANN